MREVTQTIFHEEGAELPGNCLQAAVASLLDLDLEDVPHFIVEPDWMERLAFFAHVHGYQIEYVSPDTPGGGIAIGPSPRGVQHAVVWADGAMVWDPHPSRDGLTEPGGLFLFTPWELVDDSAAGCQGFPSVLGVVRTAVGPGSETTATIPVSAQ